MAQTLHHCCNPGLGLLPISVPYIHTPLACLSSIRITRLCHGYGFTHGVPKTGIVGTGTVCHFGTPQYTAYPYRGVTGIHGLMYTKGESIILIIMYLQMSYLSFDAEICDRAEFKTPLNVVFETRPFLLLLLVLGYQAAGAQQLKGPCSLVSPRCATKAQRSDGGWMGRDKESWRLRAGGQNQVRRR